MLTAIVLAREDIREHDQRIFLYTKERGLVIAQMTGVKKITSKQSGRLEPGTLVYAEVVRSGRGDKLVAAEPVAHYPQIRRSFRRAIVVQYVLGLVASVAFPGQSDRALFEFVHIFLRFSSRLPEYALNTLCVRALWRLMAILGYDTTGPHGDLAAWHEFAIHHLERPIPAPLRHVSL